MATRERDMIRLIEERAESLRAAQAQGSGQYMSDEFGTRTDSALAAADSVVATQQQPDTVATELEAAPAPAQGQGGPVSPRGLNEVQAGFVRRSMEQIVPNSGMEGRIVLCRAIGSTPLGRAG